jgi:hypothetical protein
MKTPDYTKGWRRLAIGWLNRMVRPFFAVKVRGILGAKSGWMLYTKPDGEDGCTISWYQGTLIGLFVYRAFRSNSINIAKKESNQNEN